MAASLARVWVQITSYVAALSFIECLQLVIIPRPCQSIFTCLLGCNEHNLGNDSIQSFVVLKNHTYIYTKVNRTHWITEEILVLTMGEIWLREPNIWKALWTLTESPYSRIRLSKASCLLIIVAGKLDWLV